MIPSAKILPESHLDIKMTRNNKLSEGALFTDFYQFTMAQLYFQLGIHKNIAQFDYFFRSYPDYGMHEAGYCIFAGLEWLIDWMQNSFIGDDEICFLQSLKATSGKPLFSSDFLNWLKNKPFTTGVSLKSIPEGRVVHPQLPIVIVEGELVFSQLIESALLNQLNFQTLIATKAARIHEISQGRPVLEFGLRRAQERAASAGARAALIGGSDLSSNVGISALLGFQPSGTHAHSMVQAIMALGGDELQAFQAYADLYPDNCLLLVDTINTLESGIPNAIKVFEGLKKKGHSPLGIRLDSGDLAYLSIQSAKMLNDAGFPDTTIVLSNQMDELTIWQVITQIQNEAKRYGVEPDQLLKRLAYGVGTRMITSHGASALDGVYKLVAVRGKQNNWFPTMKISETPDKVLNPGRKEVWRLYDKSDKAVADLISLEGENFVDMDEIELHHPSDQTKMRILNKSQINKIEPLLIPILKNGKLLYDFPNISSIRDARQNDTDRLYPGVKRLISPHLYHVSLSKKAWKLKQNLIKSF